MELQISAKKAEAWALLAFFVVDQQKHWVLNLQYARLTI